MLHGIDYGERGPGDANHQLTFEALDLVQPFEVAALYPPLSVVHRIEAAEPYDPVGWSNGPARIFGAGSRSVNAAPSSYARFNDDDRCHGI